MSEGHTRWVGWLCGALDGWGQALVTYAAVTELERTTVLGFGLLTLSMGIWWPAR